MRYLSLAEALAIAEAVTGTDIETLARSARLDLLDSALHAPQAGFGDEDFYPDFVDKAAVLVVRIAKNHPLIDGKQAARVAVPHDVLRPEQLRADRDRRRRREHRPLHRRRGARRTGRGSMA